jgi:hypothetical protein
LDEVDALLVSHLLQDARCSKTLQASRRLCIDVSDPHCLPLRLDRPREVTRSQLIVLLRVATFHEFVLLKDAVRDLLYTDNST